MTREDKITIASCAYGSRGSSIDFEAGAKWADNNPKPGLIDLSKVWHDAKEKPEKGKLIIGIDDNNALTYKWENQNVGDWLYLAECFGLIRWAYVDDLLPKRGE